MAEFFDSLSGLSAAATEAASSLASAPLAAAIDSLSPDDADNIFDALDADGDGKLTLDELQSYLMARDSWCNAEDAANLFASLDADKDGVVSREELRAGLKRHAAEKPLLAWLMALRPPPAGLAVFREVVEVQAAATREEEARGEATEESTPNETDCDDCRYWKTVREPFVRPGGAVDIAEAAERAMTLWQLKTVKEHTHRRCRDEAWIGKRFAGGRMRFDLLQPQDVNLYDVASQVILPATFGHVLADGETKPSFVELVADGPQPPDYFVSHWWGEPIADFVACIAQHTMDRTYGGYHPPSRLWGDYMIDGDDARLWVCAYAIRQWHVSGEVTADPSETAFHRAIGLSCGTIAVVDKGGCYFERIWCDYEIFVSLTRAGSEEEKAKDEEKQARVRAMEAKAEGLRQAGRSAEAREEADKAREEAKKPGRYTYDVYTVGVFEKSTRRTTSEDDEDSRHDRPGARRLIDGREANRFPNALLEKGLRARVQDGQASVASDKRHILNSIRRAPLDGAVAADDPAYDAINAILHGKIVAVALQPAIEAGGAMLDVALERLAASKETHVGLSLAHRDTHHSAHESIEQATAKVMARVQGALPASVEELSLKGCHQLESFPRLSELTQLRQLDLECHRLRSLPDLSRLTQLRKLELRDCVQLRALPDLSKLVQLQTLQVTHRAAVVRSKQLESLPDLSALTQLRTLDLSFSSQLKTLPDLSALAQLQTLKLRGCETLRSLPDLSALTQLRELNLSGCKMLRSLPKLPPQLPQEKIQTGPGQGLPEHLQSQPALLRTALDAGGAILDDALEALAASKEKGVSVNLLHCEQATAKVMARVQAVLPASVEELRLIGCEQLESVHPRISELTQLRTLNLSDNKQLRSLPDLSALAQLQSLWLNDCDQLRSLPKPPPQLQWHADAPPSYIRPLRPGPPTTPITPMYWAKVDLPDHLKAQERVRAAEQTLDLKNCEKLRSLPDLSALIQLQELNLRGCKELRSLPDLSALTQLRTLDLSGCKQLASLPDLSALTQLQTLTLRGCSQLQTLPDLSGLTQLQTLEASTLMGPININSRERHMLRSLPDLSALTQLRSLGLSGCDELRALPRLPPQLPQEKIYPQHLPQHLRGSLRTALDAGGAILDDALEALAASKEKGVSVNLLHCEQATAAVMARVQAALPASVDALSITHCEQLESVHPRISELTQLRTLNLSNNKQLRSLPDLSALTQLRTLDLNGCKQLRTLPKLPPQLPREKIQPLPEHLEKQAIAMAEEQEETTASADRERVPSAGLPTCAVQ